MMLRTFAQGFAGALVEVDRGQPISGTFKPGIGPHSEDATISLVAARMGSKPEWHSKISLQVPYPSNARRKCDLQIMSPDTSLFIEAKLWRPLGDNGKPNDQIVSHILSPYQRTRSAVSDCPKLLASGFGGEKAIMIFGYEHDDWPMEPILQAFEALAQPWVTPLARNEVRFEGLVHPVHARGRVVLWPIMGKK